MVREAPGDAISSATNPLYSIIGLVFIAVSCAAAPQTGGHTEAEHTDETRPPSKAPPTGSEDNVVLFPEREELQIFKPDQVALFRQETWREISSMYQHCREWGFEMQAREAVQADLDSTLSSIGMGPMDSVGTLREPGLVIYLGSGLLDGFLMEGDITKLVVCTELAHTGPFMEAFIDRLEKRAAFPENSPIKTTPSLGWTKRYANGTKEVGLVWSDVDETAVASWLKRAGLGELPPERIPPSNKRNNISVFTSGELTARLGDELWLRRIDSPLPVLSVSP
jgi:hypothetical protein